MNQENERAMRPPEALRARVLHLVQAEPVPVRVERRWPAVLLGALAIVMMNAILFAAGGPAHAEGRPSPVGSWMVGGMLALAIAASWAALPSRRSMLGRPRGVLLAITIGVPLFVGLWLSLWHTSYVDPFERLGVRCLGLTLATAPWPFALLAHLSRRFEPRHPALAGAALGSAAGAWAAVMIELWCPLSAPSHVLVGHVLPLALLSAIGAALGARLFSLRRSAPTLRRVT